ncbi:MAG: hypothetical protein ACTHLW_21730 [Verrucomicrobiota bacterium]
MPRNVYTILSVPRIWLLPLGLLAFLVFGSSALGHGHNISTGEVQISPGELAAHLVFAEDEIRKILPMDQNGDGVVSPEEFTLRQRHLDALAPNLWKVTADGKPVALRTCRAVVDVKNDVYFDLSFNLPPATNILIHSVIVRKMVGFHRQFLFVTGWQEKQPQDVLLNPLYDRLEASDGKYVARPSEANTPELAPGDDAHGHSDSSGHAPSDRATDSSLNKKDSHVP